MATEKQNKKVNFSMATERQNKNSRWRFPMFRLTKNNKSKSEKKTKTKPRDFHGNDHHKAHEIERERLTQTRFFFKRNIS